MWEAALATEPVAEVLARATPLHAYTMRMFGVPESEIAKSLREIESEGTDLEAVEITTCLRRGEIEIDVRYRDAGARRSPRRCARACWSATGARPSASTERRSTPRSRRLLQGRRLGLAESCSGGLLAARITDLPGASAYLAGSVVAYSNEAKADLLGVDPALIEAQGAVSPEVAEAMAVGALERFGADVAVSITGIAGPEGGSEEKPVGYVCFNAQAGRRDGDRPRSGDPGQPRRHPRTLGPDRDAPAAHPAGRGRGADLGPGRELHAFARVACGFSCVRALSRAPGPRSVAEMAAEQEKRRRLRLFVALDLPARVREGIVAWGGRELRDPALRRSRAEQLHVTLAFLGHRDEEEVEPVAAAVAASAGAAPRMELGEPEARPGRSRPRVFALPVRSEGDRRRCRRSWPRGWSREGLYEAEKRPFWPHVTVARVRSERGRPPGRLQAPRGPAEEPPEAVLWRPGGALPF